MSTGGVQVYKDEEINKSSGTNSGSKQFAFSPHLKTSDTFPQFDTANRDSGVVHHLLLITKLMFFLKTSITSHLRGNASIIDTRCRVERSDFKVSLCG